MQTDPDEALIRRCQSGDAAAAEEAFEGLFEIYRDRVFNLAVRLLGNPEDAEDVAQEAFVTVFRKISDFRFSSRFYTWLYRVVYNLCVDHRRRGGSGSGPAYLLGARRDESLEVLRDPAKEPVDALGDREHELHSVERALQRLSAPLRAVVILRYMDGLQYNEIAEVLGCSVGTVKSRLSRAHAFLQATLRPS